MNSRTDELERLASLHERGVLSADEFASAKASVLGSASSQAGISRDMPPLTNEPEPAPTNTDEDQSSDFPLWNIFRPIRTTDEAQSLLKTGYYAAAIGGIQAAVFSSDFPITSGTDQDILFAVLIAMVGGAFWAAYKVATKGSVVAAWFLLILVGCQLFGMLTGGGSWLGFIGAIAGAIAGIQAVRATSAYRKLTRNIE